MSSSPPPEQRPVASLVDERERVIQQLSDHFANDRLSLDELEARMDLAYKAATVTDLQRLTADLPSVTAAAPVPVAAPADELAVVAPERERLFALLGGAARHWAAVRPQTPG